MAAIIQDLDHWSEDKFSALCAAAGVTRNKSQQDRTGWDYLVEFPPKPFAGMPSDMQPAGASAKVQVKSKGRGRPSTTLKLSNALRFAKESGPCFLVLFLASEGREPVRIYAKHFWDGLIEETFRKARVPDAAGNTEPHKVKVSITFSNVDDHTNDLVPWMADTVTSLGRRYAEEKERIVGTVGYADGGFHGTISLPLSALPEFIDHQIGLSPAAPIEQVTLSQKRFGIDIVLPLLPSRPDFVSLRSHPRPCRLRVRQVGFQDVWMDAQLFVPGVPQLPPDLVKCRVIADFLELIFGMTGSGTVNLNYSANNQRTLAATRALIDVLSMAERGPLDVSIRPPEGTLLAAAVSVAPQGLEQWLAWFSPGLKGLELVSSNAAPPDLTLSISEITAAGADLVTFSALVAQGELSGRMTFAEPISLTQEPSSFFAYGYVEVGDWVFMAVVARTVERFQVNGAELAFGCGEPRIVEGLVRQGTAGAHLEELIALYRAAMRAPGAGIAFEVCSGDFRAIAAHAGLG